MKALKKIFTSVALGSLFLALAFSCANNSSNQEKKANQAVADTINKVITVSQETKNLLYTVP